MQYLDRLYNNGLPAYFKFSLVPFFDLFWMKRFDEQRDQFKQADFLVRKSIPHYNLSSDKNKLRRLFKILIHHLEPPISAELANWSMTD